MALFVIELGTCAITTAGLRFASGQAAEITAPETAQPVASYPGGTGCRLL